MFSVDKNKRDVVLTCGQQEDSDSGKETRHARALRDKGARVCDDAWLRLSTVQRVGPKTVVCSANQALQRSLEEDASTVCVAIGQCAVETAAFHGVSIERTGTRDVVSASVQRLGAVAGLCQKDRVEVEGTFKTTSEDSIGPYAAWLKSQTTGCVFVADHKRKNYLAFVDPARAWSGVVGRLLEWCVFARAGVSQWPDGHGLAKSFVKRFERECLESPIVAATPGLYGTATLLAAVAAFPRSVAAVFVDTGFEECSGKRAVELLRASTRVVARVVDVKKEASRVAKKTSSVEAARAAIADVVSRALIEAGANVEGGCLVPGSYAPLAWAPRKDVEEFVEFSGLSDGWKPPVEHIGVGALFGERLTSETKAEKRRLRD